VRAYLRERFPALGPAPLVEARTCRYELTPDTHFVAASHPEHSSVWIVGGGSGHGFKHGPAMAERLVASFAGAPLPDHVALRTREPGRSLRTAGSGARS
jgi:sarcosine oxidase